MMPIELDRIEPITLGNEGVGRVERLHPSAVGKGFQESDVIGFLYVIGCCFECEGYHIHNLHCSMGMKLLQGVKTDRFFTEYAVVDYHNAIILPSNLDPKTASPIFYAGIICT